MNERINEIKFNKETTNRVTEINLELEKLQEQAKLVASDSPEGVQLSLQAFKLINALLDIK